MTFKNYIIKKLLQGYDRLYPKRHLPEKGKKRSFLVVSTTGLGDTLWGTPAIKALRNSFSDAKITVLTSPIGKVLLKNHPCIDEILVSGSPALLNLPSLFFALRKKQIDTVLVFHISQRPMLPLCHLSLASIIVGTKGINKELDYLLTHPLEKNPVHEIERRLQIVGEIGARNTSPLLELYVNAEDEKLADEFLSKYDIPLYIPLIGIHPGAKDKFKQWEPEHFIETGNRLAAHTGAQILVTGNKEERALVEGIASKIKGAISVVESLPLRSIACLMKRMAVMISNDTGPMHVAFAMGTPTVALFSPTDPKLCGPYLAQPAHIIHKKPTCTPCLRKKCREPFCLLQISPEEVYNAAIKLFYQKKDADEALL